MKSPLRLLSLLLVATWVLAGCEPSKDTSPPPSPSAPAVTQPSDSPTPHAAAPVSAAPDAGAPSAPATAPAAPPQPRRSSHAEASGGRLDKQNVLFVTLDTTRADRLGCYGHEKAGTPTMDALAKRGVLFEQAFTPVPLTLPSHASIMTGRYPREHGIRNNNQSGLAEDLPTLATAFQEHGYLTAAFVASFVLDSIYGLNRGFDVYEDDMTGADMARQPAEWQQPANVVTDRALKWLEANQKEHFFAWVHYYDPHDPYQPPAEYAERFEDPYDGEVAFVDDQIKRLIDWLKRAGLEDDTLVVIVGDHGESFGEHQEEGHAIFLYETNLHVPMIVAHPKLNARGRRVSTIVETVDLFPTLMTLYNWTVPDTLLSRSLVPALDGEEMADVPSYAESHHVKEAFNWAEQRSLTTARWKYIATTIPELYDRQKDPGEERNIISLAPEAAEGMLEALKDRYHEMKPGQAKKVEMSAARRAALSSLGYLEGSADNASDDFLTPDLRDPKDMYKVLLQIRAGVRLVRDRRYPEAIDILKHAMGECPKATPIYTSLATAYVESDLPELAEILLNDAIAAKHVPATDYTIQTVLGDAVLRLKRPQEAIQHYEIALGDDLPYAEVHFKLAVAHQALEDYDKSVEHFNRAIEIAPKFPEAHYNLATLLSERGDITSAMTHYEAATATSDDYAPAHYNLGMLLIQSNRIEEGVARLRKAIEVKPDYGDARINLGIALVQLKRTDEAKAVLTDALEIPRVAGKAHYLLGVAFAAEGRIDKTVELYEKALTLKPFDPAPVTELARFYLQNRKTKDAIRVLSIGAMNAPDEIPILSLYARVLATTSVDELRDGSMALELIERADVLTEGRREGIRSILATVLAEVGRFEEAVNVATLTLARAEAANKTALADTLRAQLLLYQDHKPYRSTDY